MDHRPGFGGRQPNRTGRSVFRHAGLDVQHRADFDRRQPWPALPPRNGDRFAPFFKPEWSPDLLMSQNYICHMAFIEGGLYKDKGGFRKYVHEQAFLSLPSPFLGAAKDLIPKLEAKDIELRGPNLFNKLNEVLN